MIGDIAKTRDLGGGGTLGINPMHSFKAHITLPE
jgi:hypothetical protein